MYVLQINNTLDIDKTNLLQNLRNYRIETLNINAYYYIFYNLSTVLYYYFNAHKKSIIVFWL